MFSVAKRTEEKKTRNDDLMCTLTKTMKEMDDVMREKEEIIREKEEKSRREWEEEQDAKRMKFMKDLMGDFFDAMKK